MVAVGVVKYMVVPVLVDSKFIESFIRIILQENVELNKKCHWISHRDDRWVSHRSGRGKSRDHDATNKADPVQYEEQETQHAVCSARRTALTVR